jgi:hypothetical protein
MKTTLEDSDIVLRIILKWVLITVCQGVVKIQPKEEIDHWFAYGSEILGFIKIGSLV